MADSRQRRPRILVVDDDPLNVKLLEALLTPHQYEVLSASSGTGALEQMAMDPPDLVLLDIMMPGMDGYEVCRRIRAAPSTRVLPVVMLTASTEQEKVRAIEAGADDFIQRPVNQAELLARVKSLLRVKEYQDTIQAQAAEIAQWNRTLEERVRQQVEQLERLGRLRRFLSPQVADLIVSTGDESVLTTHRREVAVVFSDLLGFTAFSETAEPEDVMGVLHQFRRDMGEVVFRFEGTLERFVGDGLMVLFNDPIPCDDPSGQAVRMALAMRQRAEGLVREWRRRGYEVEWRAGVAFGHATIGSIGFEQRLDYGAIGTVTDLASGLCEEAGAGQILITQRVYAAVEHLVEAEPIEDLSPRGFLKPTPAFRVLRLKPSAVEGAGPSLSRITRREQEVAALIARGLSNREIATALVITEGTAANHVEHILAKLGFGSRAQVAAWAVAEGLPTGDPPTRPL